MHKSLLLLASGVLIMAALLAALYVFQNRLLYLPGKASPDNYAPAGTALWPAQSDRPGLGREDAILGLLAEPPDTLPVDGTVIVFHGNAGHAGHRSDYARQLTPLGLRVLLAEYPGYGPRPGEPDEPLIIDDAITILTLAHQQYGHPIWLLGESLGAAVAAAVAGQQPGLVQGVILITPWNRLVDVAVYHYPILPVRRLLRSEYDSIQALQSFAGPVLVMVVDADKIVPPALGLDLYAHLSEPRRLILLEDASHNNWMRRVSPSMWSDIVGWLQANRQ